MRAQFLSMVFVLLLAACGPAVPANGTNGSPSAPPAAAADRIATSPQQAENAVQASAPKAPAPAAAAKPATSAAPVASMAGAASTAPAPEPVKPPSGATASLLPGCTAAVPGGDFESWHSQTAYGKSGEILKNHDGSTVIVSEPVGWATLNGRQGGNLTPAVVIAGEGQSGKGVLLEIKEFATETGRVLLRAGIGSSDNPAEDTAGMYGNDNRSGIPVAQRFQSVQGFYKFLPQPGDGASIFINMKRGGTIVGQGGVTTHDGVSSYTAFSAPILYFGEGAPDTAHIYVHIRGSERSGGSLNPTPGSKLFVDSLCYSMDLQPAGAAQLVQNAAANQTTDRPAAVAVDGIRVTIDGTVVEIPGDVQVRRDKVSNVIIVSIGKNANPSALTRDRGVLLQLQSAPGKEMQSAADIAVVTFTVWKGADFSYVSAGSLPAQPVQGLAFGQSAGRMTGSYESDLNGSLGKLRARVDFGVPLPD